MAAPRACAVPGPEDAGCASRPISGRQASVSSFRCFPYVVLTALGREDHRPAGEMGRGTAPRHLVCRKLRTQSRGPRSKAAVNNDGKILGLKMDQLEDYGAFLRAPMPGAALSHARRG